MSRLSDEIIIQSLREEIDLLRKKLKDTQEAVKRLSITCIRLRKECKRLQSEIERG